MSTDMIDFHSHILPGIDDGSKSAEESIEMLRRSSRGGVGKIVATPHFYAQEETPEQFLARRREAWERLAHALSGEMSEEIPEIRLGAEVYYFTGISGSDSLPLLCMEGSRLLLLEMSFRKWTERMTDEVADIALDREFTVLLAHIDRYVAMQSPEILDRLAGSRVLFQINAAAFLDGWGSRRRAFQLLSDGKMLVLGSDCHNMKKRKPNLDAAIDVIRKKAGSEEIRKITARAQWLWDSADGK